MLDEVEPSLLVMDQIAVMLRMSKEMAELELPYEMVLLSLVEEMEVRHVLQDDTGFTLLIVLDRHSVVQGEREISEL